MLEHKCTINHKPLSIALFASSFGIDADDEFDESFPKQRMLAKNKTLPRYVIVHTKIANQTKGKRTEF